jgi:hypothetical protein
MMTPGSANRIRLAFQIPTELASQSPGTLVVDVKGGRVEVDAPQVSQEQKARFNPESPEPGDGIAIIVNQTGRLQKVFGQKGPWYVADITLVDEQDGEATRVGRGLELYSPDVSQAVAANDSMGTVREEKKGLGNFGTNDQKDKIFRVFAHSLGESLLTGITSRTVIPDGSHRRGLVLFKLPRSADANIEWKLRSAWIPGLDEPILTTSFTDTLMLLPHLDMHEFLQIGDDRQFKDALTRAVKAQRARAIEKPGSHSPLQLGLGQGAEPAREIPVPSFVLAGADRFASIDDLDTLREHLSQLRFLPGGASPWAYQQSPEGVLTQKWGTQSEFARMAEVVLSRQGRESERDLVAVTDEGRARLAERAGLSKVDVKWLPALRYQDTAGMQRLLVSPFMQNAESLKGLVQVQEEKPKVKNAVPARLHVIAGVVANGGDRNKRAADMAGALAGQQGSSKVRERLLLNTVLDREALSRGALDIIYTSGEVDKGSY